MIVSSFQSPPDNAYFSDETPTGQLSLYFISAVFAALFLNHLTHNDWGLSRHAIRIDALWIAAFVGTVWGSKSVLERTRSDCQTVCAEPLDPSMPDRQHGDRVPATLR